MPNFNDRGRVCPVIPVEVFGCKQRFMGPFVADPEVLLGFSACKSLCDLVLQRFKTLQFLLLADALSTRHFFFFFFYFFFFSKIDWFHLYGEAAGLASVVWSRRTD